MAEFKKVTTKDQLAPGECTTVEVDGTAVALFNVGGEFYAIDNTCVHRGGPLGEGTLDDNVVTCPWHGWRYDVTTGVSVVNPAAKVAKYQVKVEGNDVLVALE